MWELTPLHGRVRLETAFHLCCPFGKHPLKWMITPKVAYSSVKINRLFWEGINKANFPCKKSLNKFYFKRIYQHWKTQRKRIRESIASQKEKKKKKKRGKKRETHFFWMLFLSWGSQNDHEEERENVASALIGIKHLKQEASITANLNFWTSPFHPSSLLFMGQLPLFANKDKNSIYCCWKAQL